MDASDSEIVDGGISGKSGNGAAAGKLAFGTKGSSISVSVTNNGKSSQFNAALTLLATGSAPYPAVVNLDPPSETYRLCGLRRFSLQTLHSQPWPSYRRSPFRSWGEASKTCHPAARGSWVFRHLVG
jgi:hypothetical protein